MFTGIVEDIGIIKNLSKKGSNLNLQIETTLKGIETDDSIACDGVCLTVENIEKNVLTFTAINETLSKTTVGDWKNGAGINLERTLKFNGRIDGHIVQGHVDCTGICQSITPAEGSHELIFSFDRKFSTLMIEKGSICINGTSLTAYNVQTDSFTVSIIPYTWGNTNFHNLRVGDKANLEFDMIGKYIQRFLTLKDAPK